MNRITPPQINIAALSAPEAEPAQLLRTAQREETDILRCHFKNYAADGNALDSLNFHEVLFENCRFLDCSFEKSAFSDVVFKACDFSGSVFTDAYFCRCTFVSCKGMGAEFPDVSMHETAFENANFGYASWDNARLNGILIQESDFSYTTFNGCKGKNWLFSETDFNGASFFRTSLKGIDLTSCRISGIAVSDSFSELKGAVVSVYQAAELAKLLGLEIQ